MASYVFDQVKRFAGSGSLNFDTAPDGHFRIVLCTGDVLNSSAHSDKEFWSELSGYEITENDLYNDDGYPNNVNSVPGSSLNGVGINTIADANGSCDDGLPDNVIYAEDVVYNVSTIDADAAIIVRESSTTGEYDLITALDLRIGGDPVRSNTGVFSLLLSESSGGFLIIK